MSQVFPSGGQVLELVFSITVQTYILEFEASDSERVETAHWGQSWEEDSDIQLAPGLFFFPFAAIFCFHCFTFIFLKMPFLMIYVYR